MFKRLFTGAALFVALSTFALAQNSNTSTGGTSTGRTRTPAHSTQTPTAPAQTPTPAPARTTTRRGTATSTDSAEARAVRDAFDSLVDGIRKADAKAVMALYWNSPQLSVFNNNGTVTRSWEQVRSNRESLYSKVSDVKLDVRDVRVKTLGTSAAIVTCLWEQTQMADGQQEHATGRLTVVYQKVGADWKIVHTHTSPDHPNPANLLPSERTTEGDATRPPTKP